MSNSIYGGFTGFGSRESSPMPSFDDYMLQMNLSNLDMLSEPAESGLLGAILAKPTIENPYLTKKPATAEEVADFNKAFIKEYGAPSFDPFGLGKALASGGVSKTIENRLIPGTDDYRKEPIFSYTDEKGNLREFSGKILSDYQTMPKKEFQKRYSEQFGGLGHKLGQMYDTFEESGFYDLLEDYLPYATGEVSDLPGRSVFDRLSDIISGPDDMPTSEIPNKLDFVGQPENYYPEEISGDEMQNIIDYLNE